MNQIYPAAPLVNAGFIPVRLQAFFIFFAAALKWPLIEIADFKPSFPVNRFSRCTGLVLLFFIQGFIAHAQISSTATGGNWNTPATWVGGVVPAAGTAVTISGGATVTVNTSGASCFALQIGGGARATATLSFTNVGILTVSGNVVVGANRQRRGTINMSAGGSFKIGGLFTVAALNNFTRGTGTVEYNGNGAQTIGALGSYNNLVLSGNGVKSFIAGSQVIGKLAVTGARAGIGTGLKINVGSLALGGANRAGGTWGSSISTAANKNDSYFAPSAGVITVAVDGRPAAAFSGITTPPGITYGSATIALNGAVSSAGPVYPVDGETVAVTINGLTQNAVIAGGTGGFTSYFPTATFDVPGGPYAISYAYQGGFNLAPAAANTNTALTVSAASLTITASNVKKSYGTTITGAAGSTAFTSTGLQKGQTLGTVRITYGTGASSASTVGTYTGSITPSNATGGTINPANYRITYAKGQIIVTTAPLTITAKNQTKAYGTAIALGNTAFSVTGLLNGNTVTGVTLTSPGSVTTAPVSGSPYAVVPSAATGNGLGNYSIVYNNGILTVTGLNQSFADFRTKASGNFSSSTCWEFDQGGNSWTNATQPPAINNNISIVHGIILNQNYTTGAGKTLLIGSGGSLTVNPGITLDVAASGAINFNGKPVTIKSTAAGTGAIGKIAGILTDATSVTVERFIPTNKRAWRMLTIPVTGTTIRQAWTGVAPNAAAPSGEIAGTGTLITGHGYSLGATAAVAGFDWFSGLGTSTTSSIRYYSAAAAWASVSNTPNILALPNKEGYFLYVRGDRTIANNSGLGITTLKPTGTLKQGTQTIPVNDPYTVVGNPYAAAISLDNMYLNPGNSAVINRNFWVWDATLGTSGGYRTLSWNGVDGYDMTVGSGLAADYLVVNSGQAFFVERRATGNIRIQETNKTTATTPKLLRSAAVTGSVVSSLNIRLCQATGAAIESQSDMVIARYNDAYNESPTESYDAAKLNNFNENLSLVRNNNYLSIESRPFPAQTDTLYLTFWGLTKRDYALQFTGIKFTGVNQTASLIDAYTNKTIFINLNDSNTIYPFAVTTDPASSSLNRFRVVMAPATVLPVSFAKITATRIGKPVSIDWETANEQGLKNYAVERSQDAIHFKQIGETTPFNTISKASYQWIDLEPFPANNYYRVRSNDKDGRFAYSKVAAIKITAAKGIEVAPTIINDKQFVISFNNQPAGNYRLSITNTAGQQVFLKTIQNSAGMNSCTVGLGNTSMPKGIYNLSVTGSQGIGENFRLMVN